MSERCQNGKVNVNEQSKFGRAGDDLALLTDAKPRLPESSPYSTGAEAIFRQTIAVSRHPPSRRRRQAFTLAVAAGTAATVAGTLVLARTDDQPSDGGSNVTVAPAMLADVDPTSASNGDPSDSLPAVADAPPIGESNTSRASITLLQGASVTRINAVVADQNVALTVSQTDGVNDPGTADESRFVDGDWYHETFVDGELQWIHDSEGGGFPGSIPAASAPRTLYAELSPAANFEVEGVDLVDGVETVRHVAATPGAIDVNLLPLDGLPDAVDSVEVYVDSLGIVRRLDIAFVENLQVSTDGPLASGAPEPVATIVDSDDVVDQRLSQSVSITFRDIGEPMTVEAPRDAREIDSAG